MIDLSALNGEPDDQVTPVSEPDGTPFRIKLADIERDPKQPRSGLPRPILTPWRRTSRNAASS